MGLTLTWLMMEVVCHSIIMSHSWWKNIVLLEELTGGNWFNKEVVMR